MPEGNLASSQFGIGELQNQLTREGLTQVGIDGRARPRLAESWTWDSDERLRLTLRGDVLLHDGREFDSQLAAESLALAVADPSNLALYPALADIAGAIPVGRLELVLVVSKPSSLLAEDLTVLLDVPAGPYRFVPRPADGLASADDIVLERFDRHYLGAPPIPVVVLRPLDTLRTSWASLLRGELDVVYDLPADTVQFIENDDVQIVSVRRWYQYVIAFNSRLPAVRSPVVRRALNLAIDRDRLVSGVMHGAGEASSGPLWPGYWAADASVTPYAFDPEQARILLDAAGFPLRPSATGGPPARFTITCLIPEGFSEVERLGLQVQKDLFAVGVDMRFRSVPSREFGRLMGSGQFEATLLDMVSGPTPGRAYIFWASADRFRGAYNIFGYENPEAQRLFETLLTTRSEAAVRSATWRLQRVLLEDPPALFLAWSTRARAISRDYEVPEEPGTDPMFTLWRWRPRTDRLVALR